METNMLVNLKIINITAKELIHLLMETNMLVNLKIIKANGQGTLTYADGSYCTGIFENDKCLSDIVKADPNKNKPKKKVEVAKVEEPKQEEIKSKSTNQDKDPPVIQIASNITVSDTTYEIEGVVKDNSENIFVEIDGQTIQAKNGKFKLQRYSPIDHQLKIVAVDQWGNRSEPKLVDIKIELQVAKSASIIEPLNPSNLKVKADRNKVALVIGVEKYENTPSAKFASLDAKYFKDYARKAFGVHEDNINLLTDEEANFSKTTSAFFKWLPSKIKSNKTDLIIFYAGHGLASSDGKDKYILPFDADPDLLSRTAISRKEIFDLIISLKPRSVTIFLDTCYSGVSRDEQMLLASARPLRVIADDDEKLPDNFTIFSASENDQISSGLESAKHGIFSYYLMKGLEGKADEILKNTSLYDNPKFSGTRIEPHDYYQNYTGMQFTYKTNDEKFILHGVSGLVNYKGIENNCVKIKEDIENQITVLFNNEQYSKRVFDTPFYELDKTGQSTVNMTEYAFDTGGSLKISCFYIKNEELKKDYYDSLRSSFQSEELVKFLSPGFIEEFEINGLSVKKSLLNFYNINEIRKNQKVDKNYPKFLSTTFKVDKVSKNYNVIEVFYKKDDSNYNIYAVEGILDFPKNPEACLVQREEVVAEISDIFKDVNIKKFTNTLKREEDKSGKSFTTFTTFYFRLGDIIVVECNRWSKKMKFMDNLRVRIYSKDYK
jgi:hypothetical protein